MDDLIKAIDKITEEEIIKLVISNKLNKDTEYKKIVFQLKEKNKKDFYQIEKYTEKQVFHENIEKKELKEKIEELFVSKYKQLNAFSKESSFDLKVSKKGKVFLGIKKNNEVLKVLKKEHNRKKNYILEEGMIIEPLIDLGVFTKEGKVINSKYDKYKQINRFIEIIDDEIKKIKVNMIGLDLKADVIKKCNEIAKKYNYENLHFELGDINGFKYNNKVDMVITLHACDTATDYALYNAIKWNSKMIFSVPCCQHEFNSQIESEKFSILTNYGIIKERISALMTDSVRANLLECAGYKTQLLEFIDIAHSPKNILIRATKGNVSKGKKEKALSEVNNLMNEFNLSPTLYKLLKEDNLI
ncbi:methyltransferase [Clostridium perfringens D str. JGS1721]|uniref:Methyltransferase n=1 Tax=Clostridium perfringens D str. JGS1721 TaxID=488537 RepID=B1V586_CLOPF|nr:SAM-dependent methyltransferase [Clostridium perfringens]EDT71017.1 methyltransferase [Clostridium perfringens D str. JGS1721]